MDFIYVPFARDEDLNLDAANLHTLDVCAGVEETSYEAEDVFYDCD